MLISGEYHTDNPEKDNVISGYQHIRRIEIIQVFRLIRPAQCRERPQRRGEPCIQRILILCKMRTAALRALLRRMAVNNNLAALIAVVCRDSVSPPDLTGDAPVLNIFQPVQINLVKAVRHKLQLSCFQSIDGRFCQFFHLYKPLLFDQRLYCSAAAVMGSDRVSMGNDLYKVSLLFQIFYDSLSRLIAVHSGIFSAFFIDRGIVIHNVDFFQIVALAHFKVIRVVSRRNLHSSGSELLIYIVVRYNRNLPAYQRQDNIFPDNILVSLIIRMHRNRRISQHSFRTGRSDLQEPVCSDNRILDVPEMSFLFLMFHLCI